MMRLRTQTTFAVIILAASATEAPAEEAELGRAPAVLELYTSQGCSSCPAADAVLDDMVKAGKVIGLTFSVDYWDYLGWKDTLGSPQHTERQRAYVKAAGGGQVYTPQLVINGITTVVGSDRDAIRSAIAKSNRAIAPQRVPISLKEDDGALLIEAGAPKTEQVFSSSSSGVLASARRKIATIWLALVRRNVEVKIKNGENRGRVLHYVNAVRAFTPIGMWTGVPVTLRLPKKALMRGDADGAIAVIQEEGQGPILGAAELKLR